MKKRERRVGAGLAVILLGFVVLAATTTFNCSEASCGPSFTPSIILIVVATFVVGAVLLFGRRRR